MRGAINVGLGGSFATWCGTVLDQARAVVLVAEPGRVLEAATRLGRIGFEGRHDYAASGSVVNLAARLCGEAASGQIIVERKVMIAVEEIAESEELGPLTLKGFHRAVPAFNVRGLRG